MGWRLGRILAARHGAGLLPAFLLLLLPPCLVAQKPADVEGPQTPLADVSRPHLMDNEAVIRMAKAGLGEDLVLQTIRLQPGHYNTSPDDLIALKDAGVPEKVILAMQAYGTGLQLRATAAPVAAPSPARLLSAPGVDEIGVYYQDTSGQWTPLKLERVEFKSGGWIKSTVTHNIVKQDLNGHLEHAQSPLVLPTGTHLLIYAPEGTAAQEYDFLRFREHSSAREFRVQTGGVFHSETGSARDEIQFTPQKVGRQLFEFILPADIEKGEYGVLPPGSANMRGLSDAGKIYTFSIRQ